MTKNDTKGGLSKLPPKPTAKPKAADVEKFVSAGEPQAPAPEHHHMRTSDKLSLAISPIEAEEPTQRLSLDIPLSLHVLIKSGCALRRTKMKEEIMALLEGHYRPQE